MVGYVVIKNHVINPIMVECRMAGPPNPPDLAQAIAAMLTGRDEQTALLREIVEQGRAQQLEHHHQPPCSWISRVSCYSATALP